MKFHTDGSRILWLLIPIAVVVVIVIFRIGFHFSIPGMKEETVTSLMDYRQQKVVMKPNRTKPAASENSPKSVFQSSNAAELRWELPKERRYCSEHPLYFRVVFGKEGKKSMLGVIDESSGTGTGYNVAYMDENMNGDLTDDIAKEYSRHKFGNRADELESGFEFDGPFEKEGNATYILNIYSLARKSHNSITGNVHSIHWSLNTKEWYYFFLYGKMELFSSAADAMKGKPVHLGSQCQWKISFRIRDDDGKPMISAGLKDKNGCTLRVVRRLYQDVSPTLTLIKDSKVRRKEKMKFG